MYNKDALNNLAKQIGVPIYVYDGSSKIIASYNGTDAKESAAPGWIISMAESGAVRKLFKKDNKTSAYYCFAGENGKYIIFQDNSESVKLGIFVKSVLELISSERKENGSISGETEEHREQSQEVSNLKKEIMKSKAEQTKLTLEIKQKNSLINDLQNKLSSSGMADIEAMQKTIKDLKEVNNSQMSQIRRMKSDMDHVNFQKMKQVNAELREEVSTITFKAAEAEDKSNKIQKILQNTVEELNRLMEAASVSKNDLRALISKASVPSFKDSSSGPSLTGVKYESKDTPGLPSNPKKRQIDISDIVNAINAAISANDASGINLDKLSTIVPISDKEGVKRSPAYGLKPLIGTLIGMSKASRLSPLQMNTLCDALGIRQ